jgi:hypothetical protein
MTRYRLRPIAVLAIFAAASISSSASAASFDGYYRLIAQTTDGHCGVQQWNVAISKSQFAFPGYYWLNGWPMHLTGTVSGGGRAQMQVTAGPRVANATGQLGKGRGTGKWAGTGPSGACSGIWSIARLQPNTPAAPGLILLPSWPTPPR